MIISTIGHVAPPVTGENICRQRLESALRDCGFIVNPFSRRSAVLGCRNVLRARVLIIVNGESWLGTVYDYLFIIAALVLRKRVFCYFHNRSWSRFAWLPASIFVRSLSAERIRMFVLTEKIRAEMSGAGLSVRILNNSAGADFDAISCEAASRLERRLLWMGRPENAKGFDLALATFTILRRSDPRWTFDVYGSDGSLLPQLTGLKYHGFVAGVQKMNAFRLGGVFILPSRYSNETQPLSIIEAMAAGLPVVASDVGGIAEMLGVDGVRAGFVIGNGLPESYASAVENCIKHFGELSSGARRIYQMKYSYRIYSDAVAEEFGVTGRSP